MLEADMKRHKLGQTKAVIEIFHGGMTGGVRLEGPKSILGGLGNFQGFSV